jgi:CHAT domain-containing protein
VFLAQEAQAPESLYRWQWQSARLLRNDADPEHDPSPALAAYQRATATLQSIRHDLAIAYANRGSQSSFREQVGPLFFEQADLQLRQARRAPNEEQRRAHLIAARNTVESLKSAELADYFRDDCVDILKSKEREIDAIASGTAVAYLIPLPDRLELLVTLPEGLKEFQVPVGSGRVEAEVRAFRRTLEDRTTYDFLPHAQKLYEWIIAPMRDELTRQQIDTLVFVPDGALRTTPMAALHDGERCLIESYALAITPGLKLMEPRPIERKNVQLLSSGLSEGRAGFAPLPHVPQELRDLRKLFGGVVLLDGDFRERNLEQQMTGQSYSIVHVASHGRFSSNARETFLLTYDDKLDLNELERLIQPSQFRGQPVELLTLSACQTAAGDDRAALGLAGIAVKAGARSAAATLWFVNDEASSQLVTHFYEALNDPRVSKAQAMRRAQLRLLADRRYEHPCYWAPFLIIGNWL